MFIYFREPASALLCSGGGCGTPPAFCRGVFPLQSRVKIFLQSNEINNSAGIESRIAGKVQNQADSEVEAESIAKTT